MLHSLIFDTSFMISEIAAFFFPHRGKLFPLVMIFWSAIDVYNVTNKVKVLYLFQGGLHVVLHVNCNNTSEVDTGTCTGNLSFPNTESCLLLYCKISKTSAE